MKKSIFIFVLNAFTAAAVFSLLTGNFITQAAPLPEQSVYYSEPLGVSDEKKVFHIDACEKTKSYAPLRCSKPLIDNSDIYDQQCMDAAGKIKKGTLIKGCLTGVPAASGYPEVDVGEFNAKQCEESEKQGYKYVPEWAVLSTRDKCGEEGKLGDCIFLGSFAWNANDIAEIPANLTSEFGEGQVAALYRPVLCVTWDVIAGENGEASGEREPVGKLQGMAQTLFDSAVTTGIQNDLIEKGCNNDNSDTSPQYKTEDISSVPPPSVTCSTKYRITGKTGVGIFSQYISALYKWAAGIVGIVAVLVIVFSGIQISIAGADSAALDNAKTRIMQSIVGLVILFLAGLILYTINPGFFN